jgi:hypothetical protein
MGHDDLLDTTIDTGLDVAIDPQHELDALLDDLTSLLKTGDVIASLTARGINASIALCAANGLGAYLKGKKAEAADDLSTAADEIRGRIAAPADGGRRA